MKTCVIQPYYPLSGETAEDCFEKELSYLAACDPSMDLIVMPEYSDVPALMRSREEVIAFHEASIGKLLGAAADTAKRCDAVVFVNGLCKTDTGYRNTTYAFDRRGTLAGQYFKRHLPPVELFKTKLDKSYTLESDEPYTIEIDGVCYAFLTCYDFYFYEAVSRIAREKPDIIIGCSHQRSDGHDFLLTCSKFYAYNTNAYVVRASISLGEDSPICGGSMIVAPDASVLLNMESRIGMETAEFDPHKKFYKPAGFGNPDAPHYEYIEFGRRPWQYRPAGSAIGLPEGEKPYPRICAHRGFSAVAPENSMPAFGAAVALGASEIEFDLWKTKDGEIVSIHDPSLERVSDGCGFVTEHTYEELLQYDFGVRFSEKYKGLRIVRFSDILEKYSCHVIMNIHVKPDDYPTCDEEMLDKVVRLIDRYDCRKYVYFMSCFECVHTYLKKIAPDIPRCCGESPEHGTIVDRAIAYGAQKVQLFKPYFDQAMIDKAHEHGILCNVFFADDPEEAKRYLAMGIDTILTNDYLRIATALDIK